MALLENYRVSAAHTIALGSEMNVEPPAVVLVASSNWSLGTALGRAFCLKAAVPDELQDWVSRLEAATESKGVSDGRVSDVYFGPSGKDWTR
jgi:hypothetical protein